jgi:hypothetical protein
MTTENGQPSAPSASRCYAIFADGVYEGIEHYRGQKMARGCAEMVNFEFRKLNGFPWRGEIPATDVFTDRESAQAEWDRRFA